MADNGFRLGLDQCITQSIYLSHLRFADDILICANTPHGLHQMLNQLADESDNRDLKMIKSTTKVKLENNTTIYVNNIQIGNVES